MKFGKRAVLAAGCAVLACASMAVAATASDTIAARQANFKVMGKAMKGSFDELKQPSPSMVKAAQAYQQAAASGNLDAAKAALMQVGGTCKGCHDTFRAKDQ